MYRAWGSLLPPDVELCALELPGRGMRMREAHAPSIDALAQELVSELQQLSDVTLVLFGHSFGAVVAFELAHLLSRRGCAPRALCVSACPHPEEMPRIRAWSELPEAEFVERVLQLGGTPPALLQHPEARELYLAPLRHDLRLLWSHPQRARTPLTLPIDVLAATDDPCWPRSSLAAWSRESAIVREHQFSGGHFFIREHAARVVDLLCRVTR